MFYFKRQPVINYSNNKQYNIKFVKRKCQKYWAVPWLRRLVAGLPPRMTGFEVDPSGREV
jgi:hypothetical protein